MLVGGLVVKINRYARTPAPLKIPTTPAPTTTGGVVLRMAREVALFESLFKSNKWIWLFGWLFHVSLLLVVLRHLRYFTEPVWFWVESANRSESMPASPWWQVLVACGHAASWWIVCVIFDASDHLMLMLLIGIGLTGLGMSFVAHTDIVAVKAFFIGLMVFDLQPLPADPVLLVHLTLVALLMVIFPISKLLHAPGIFFSPTRNQTDDSRERRHIAPWATKFDASRVKSDVEIGIA